MCPAQDAAPPPDPRWLSPHRFREPQLLTLALTHASSGEGSDNERLEFLGDAVLGLVVSEALYLSNPTLAEGALSELRAWVVSRRTLCEASRRLRLEARAAVGRGLDGRELPTSVLANLYEALLGAVYLDGGFQAARRFVKHTLGAEMAGAAKATLESNPKQRLQQLSQHKGGQPPTYVQLSEQGLAHARAFQVAAQLGETRYPAAWGRTRKEAERWAAFEALLVLEAPASAESRA